VYLLGKKSNKICEPSSGGIGNRLNANRNKLRYTANQSTLKTIGGIVPPALKPRSSAIAKKKMNDKIRFENGPAADTFASSIKGFLNFLLSTGTGFAQPIIAKPDANAITGTITLPRISTCFIGFSVSLPSFFAVSSPSLNAKKACAN